MTTSGESQPSRQSAGITGGAPLEQQLREALLETYGEQTREGAGCYLAAYAGPGVESVGGLICFTEDGGTFFAWPSQSDAASDLMLDVADELDPVRAHSGECAVVALYVRATDTFTVRVFFGPEARRWNLNPDTHPERIKEARSW